MAHDATYFIKQMLSEALVSSATLAATVELQQEQIDALKKQVELLQATPTTVTLGPRPLTETAAAV